ncbi:hypothetical protein [Desulfocurvibacter africanus]|uniref:hypothetical protein n=1 Tax=Desulfocurvibacter africanus TaxID=873 RepID=UPI0004830E0E|nr:hypothetical protein [Desulfocurvibacter africanus]
MKPLLMIAYHFPPDAAVGAIRTQKFVKYLPGQGWRPHVLTVKPEAYDAIDPGRLEDVGEANVIRAPQWTTPWELILRLRRTQPGAHQAEGDDRTGSNGGATSRLRQVARDLASTLNIPDRMNGWIIPAVAAGLGIMRRNHIKHIYATVPPFSVGAVGYILSCITGATLILDCRDLWTFFSREGVKPVPPHILWLNTRIERMILRRSAAIICTTKQARRQLCIDNPDLGLQSKAHVIFNGYDSDDVPTRKRTDDRLVISHMGEFYIGRDPSRFLCALAEVLKENSASSKRMRVDFYGPHFDGLAETVERLNLEDIVTIHGIVPYRQALQAAVDSDLLLLFQPRIEIMIPSKSFDYLAARQPILAFTDAGAVHELINECKAGICVRQDDVAGIKQVLHSLLQGELKLDKSLDLSPYERKAETTKLAGILENLTTVRPGNHT